MHANATAAIAALHALGLSAAGVLGSTGTRRHAERLARGTVTEATLARYAQDMATIVGVAGSHIPSDFWDVQSLAMHAAGLTEYAAVARLAQPDYTAYVRLLGRAFARFCALQEDPTGDTALAATCDLLRLSVAAVRSGVAAPVFTVVPRFSSTARALFLWQQLVSGTTRWVPVVQRPLFPHSVWSRYNVATMWQYRVRRGSSVAALWGVSGLHAEYVGAPHNTNQIEHLTISAVLQAAHQVPTALLNFIEIADAALTPAVPTAERDADIALNRAVAHEFLPRFTLAKADDAIEHLRAVLAAPVPQHRPVTRVPVAVLLVGGVLGVGAVGWVMSHRQPRRLVR
ncbi:MAG: hypothetical protein H0X24_17550 [Ktedonobacterales bacterium]|nr:hypothetical protein [Ktedonobacterales bacterium]